MTGRGAVAGARRHPLADPAFRWFAAGRLVSLLGSAMTPVALAFAVLHASGRSGDLGVVLAAESVPLIVFLLLGGAIADRFPRSAVLLVSHTGAGLTQAAAAVVLLTGHYSLLGTSPNVARILGPSLAGLLVVTVGGGWASPPTRRATWWPRAACSVCGCRGPGAAAARCWATSEPGGGSSGPGRGSGWWSWSSA